MQYYGTRLSGNISRRDPEGYLLCLNVPVARTGVQEYYPEELGLTDSGLSGSALIPVLRPEEEVFSPETIASFQGMPVTNDHPAEGVDIENIRRLQMGHAHNIRRGSGDESDLLLADLIITDPILIDAVLAGKREISCGYTYELHEENGQYIQRRIRGNHIAVVDAGRAGPRVSIKDEKPFERSISMKKPLTRLLARMAKDGEIEAVAEFIEEVLEGDPAAIPAAEPASAADPAAVTPVAVAVAAPADPPAEAPASDPAESHDSQATLEAILTAVQQLITLLTPAASDACGEADPVNPANPASDDDPEAIAAEVTEAVEEVLSSEDPEDQAAAEHLGEALAEVLAAEPSSTIGPESEAEDSAFGHTADTVNGSSGRTADAVNGAAAGQAPDALDDAILSVRPALARAPKPLYRKVRNASAARLRRSFGQDTSGNYRKILSRKPAPAAEKDYADLGRRIMEKRNPNYMK